MKKAATLVEEANFHMMSMAQLSRAPPNIKQLVFLDKLEKVQFRRPLYLLINIDAGFQDPTSGARGRARSRWSCYTYCSWRVLSSKGRREFVPLSGHMYSHTDQVPR